MSLLSGSATIRRFIVESTDLKGQEIGSRLQDHAFREPIRPSMEATVGFTDLKNPYRADFTDPNRYENGCWVVFGLRIDKRKIPGKLLASRLEEAMDAWCKEHGVERCPRVVRRDLQERIEEELVCEMSPKTGSYQIAWNRVDNYVLCDTLTDAVADVLRKLFYRAFGARLTPWRSVDAVADEGDRDKLLSACNGPIVQELLTWLWWKTEYQARLSDEIESAWIDNRVLLSDPNANAKVTLTGDNPSMSREARTALSVGKIPKEVRLGIRGVTGEEYLVTLKGDLDLAGAMLPWSELENEPGDDVMYAMLSRLDAYERLALILTDIIRSFAAERMGAGWPETSAEIRLWGSAPHPESDRIERFAGLHAQDVRHG